MKVTRRDFPESDRRERAVRGSAGGLDGPAALLASDAPVRRQDRPGGPVPVRQPCVHMDLQTAVSYAKVGNPKGTDQHHLVAGHDRPDHP